MLNLSQRVAIILTLINWGSFGLMVLCLPLYDRADEKKKKGWKKCSRISFVFFAGCPLVAALLNNDIQSAIFRVFASILLFIDDNKARIIILKLYAFMYIWLVANSLVLWLYRRYEMVNSENRKVKRYARYALFIALVVDVFLNNYFILSSPLGRCI